MAANTISDSPPFIPECEIFESGVEDGEARFKQCKHHQNTIPVCDLTLDHFPERFRHHAFLEYVHSICIKTVKIRVNYTSESRPDTFPGTTTPYPYAQYKGRSKIIRVGTGFIPGFTARELDVKIGICPCPLCKQSGFLRKKYMYFSVLIQTAAHVVFDDSEAENTVCEVFYDSPDKKDVMKVYGTRPKKRYQTNPSDKKVVNDITMFYCVSHDLKLYTIWKRSLYHVFDAFVLFFYKNIPAIVSHPHGLSKRVSFGTAQYIKIGLSETHTPETAYTLPINTRIVAWRNILSQYPEIFSQKRYDSRYSTKQPLKVFNITCDTSQYTTIPLPVTGEPIVISFPKDCKMSNMDGDVEIKVEGLEISLNDLMTCLHVRSHVVTYDMPTCNGSSGAYVTLPLVGYPPGWPCHFGKVSEESEMNRSGYYSWSDYG